MILIIWILVILFIIIGIILTVDWVVHLLMVKENSRQYGWGSYLKFKEEFMKYNWSNEYWQGYSLWDRNNNCQFHANIIKFNNIGMIIKNPFDLFLVKKFIKKYYKNLYPLYPLYKW